MRLGEPVYWWGLVLVPFMVLFFALTEKAKLKAKQKFSNLKLLSVLADTHSQKKVRWKKAFTLFSVLLVVLCLARPQWGSKLVEVKKQGIDIIFAVDVSLSMLAEDTPPSRLERAKLEVSDFIDKLKGDRVGLVVFAGAAHISCPLTLDYRAVQLFLDNIQAGVITTPSTNIAEAIRTSALAFSQKEKKYKVLVLVSDGEDQGNQPAGAAQEAAQEGIRVYTIGVGTPAGEPIPLREPGGKFLGYKKDEKGAPVLSRLDEKTLAEIARIGQGKYLSLARGGYDLDQIYTEISGMEKKELAGTLAVEYLDRYQIFLFWAILFLTLDLFMTDRKKTKTVSVLAESKTAATISAVLLILLGSAPSVWGKNPTVLNSKGNQLYKEGKYQEAAKLYEEGAVEKPESFQLQYNLANALQQSQNYGPAFSAYQRAIQTGDSHNLSLAHYNLGNSLFRAEQYQEAVASYRKALELNPSDMDAKFNYELALKKMPEQSSPSQEQQEKQKQQQKQEQQNQQQSQPQKSDQQKQNQKQEPQEDKAQKEPPRQPSQSQLNQQEAERILEALAQKEREKNQEKMKELKNALLKQSTKGKDW